MEFTVSPDLPRVKFLVLRNFTICFSYFRKLIYWRLLVGNILIVVCSRFAPRLRYSSRPKALEFKRKNECIAGGGNTG